ncbi:DUF4296 domain-containing protein [Porphyromonas gingivicanis]|uniref:DUF4296 domain-containing protein n=1 Tax=Porphyromonas gingivicanis TaxID=266762 RepID=UPI000A8F307D|nr:DUF4296 domain-containing protein [Porphyromonas gingivicanis]
MRRYLSLFVYSLFILLGSIFFLSCSDNAWENKLSRKELQSCLEDLYTMEQAIKSTPLISNDTLHLALQKTLFQKYGLTPQDFDSIIFYYNKNNPLLYADIARKASENTRNKLRTLHRENLFIAQSQVEKYFQEFSFFQLNSAIPQDAYPRLIKIYGDKAILLHTAHIKADILKETQLSLRASIVGLPDTMISRQLQDLPKLSMSYYVADTLQIHKSCPIDGRTEYELILKFDKTYPSGILNIGIEQTVTTPALYNSLLIEKLELSRVSKTPDSINNSILSQALPTTSLLKE